MKRLLLVSLVLLSWASLLCAQSSGTDQALAQGADNPELALDFSYKPPKGIFPGFNYFNLLGGTISPSLLLVDQWFGQTSTYMTVAADLQPYAAVTWSHYPDGSNIDPYGADASRATFHDLNLVWNVIVYQGLAPSQELIGSINPVNLFLGYRGYYSLSYDTIDPNASIYQSSRADRFQSLSNVLVGGLIVDTISINRFLNTKEGIYGKVLVEWAPQALVNDILGLSDYLRLFATLSFNLPLVEEPTVSLYLFQKTAFDVAWYRPGAMPIHPEYANGLLGSSPVRGAIIPDGGAMHAAGNLDLRLNFPQAIDTSIMPGFVAYWDWALYDQHDYLFSLDGLRTSLGLDFVLHLDLSALTPASGSIDMQLGVAWELVQNQARFHFSTSLPF